MRTLNITRCARCGRDHPVSFERLLRPVEDAGGPYRWWGECPVTGQPVLMRDEEDEPDQPTERRLGDGIHRARMGY